MEVGPVERVYRYRKLHESRTGRIDVQIQGDNENRTGRMNIPVEWTYRYEGFHENRTGRMDVPVE